MIFSELNNYDACLPDVAEDRFELSGWSACTGLGSGVFSVYRFGIAGLSGAGAVGCAGDGDGVFDLFAESESNWDNLYLLDIGCNQISNLTSGRLYASIVPVDDLAVDISLQGYWLAEDDGDGGLGKNELMATETDLDIAYDVNDCSGFDAQVEYVFAGYDLIDMGAGIEEIRQEGVWFLGDNSIYRF